MTTSFKIINLDNVIYYLGFFIIRNPKATIVFIIQKACIFKILKIFEKKNVRKIKIFIAKKDNLIYIKPNYYTNLLLITFS